MDLYQQQTYMRHAIEVARKGLAKGYLPIGAVIIGNGEPIATAYNMVSMDAGLLRHAELQALIQVDDMKKKPCKRKEMALFTTLEPCMKCLGAAMNLHIGSVYYGLGAGVDGFVQHGIDWDAQRSKASRKLLRMPVITSDVLKEECRLLFAEYVEKYPDGFGHPWARQLAGIEL